MIRNQLSSMKRLHFRVPLLLRRGQALVEILEALLKVSGVARINLTQLRGDSLGDTSAVVRIEPVVRVPQRMHVAQPCAPT